MKSYLKIAWRNLWRNTRRTLITSASIFFGVFFAVLTTSMQQGTFENMVDNMVRFYSGYLQVQEKGFKENKGDNRSFIPDEKLIAALNNNEHINKELQVYTWKDLQPELDNLIEGKQAGGAFMKGLLFMIIGFGVWATIIMLMNERKRELGVMIALGMRKSKLFAVLMLESFFIAKLNTVQALRP